MHNNNSLDVNSDDKLYDDHQQQQQQQQINSNITNLNNNKNYKYYNISINNNNNNNDSSSSSNSFSRISNTTEGGIFNLNVDKNNNNNNNYEMERTIDEQRRRISKQAINSELINMNNNKNNNSDTSARTNAESMSIIGHRQHREEDVVDSNIDIDKDIDDDDDSEYEADEGTERMQMSGSDYDDVDDYDDLDDDNDDDNTDDDVKLFDDDDEENVERGEPLPEAKSLTQISVEPVKDEEEDMGYDEDDERIAIAVKRPEELRPRHDSERGFVNEEGSGAMSNGGAGVRYKNQYNNNDNGYRLYYLDKYRRSQQKLLPESERVDARESSGNFANDDDDGNDDDDDGDGSDDDDDDSLNDDDDDGFYNAKRKSNNRYFRKNTNDAIKIISTPLGKVGIVYQQTPNGDEEKKPDEETNKKSSSFTDFDALSPDPESSHRLASSHPKITPVLTPDGKVALLYRGDSESSKYEPIRNLTHKFANSNEGTDNKAHAKDTTKLGGDSGGSNGDGNNDSERIDEDSYADSSADEDDDDDTDGIRNNKNPSNGDTKTDAQPDTNSNLPAIITPTTTGTFIIRPTDSVLPMINRPLSEVLGIKKNQFKQFRIKDTPTTTTSPETVPRSLAGGANNDHSDSTTLHFLTKVNLADYPTSARTRNRDFDFSRDNTMLDERSRKREQELQQQQQQQQQQRNPAENSALNENKLNTIANEEILSKTEVVNLAIIPHFDEEELERLQRLREHENRRHHRQRHRHKQTEEDLSGIHCVMQAMMGIAAISTVFGMLGTFFKQRILDQLRLMHW